MVTMLKVTSRLEVFGRIIFGAGLKNGFEAKTKQLIEDLKKAFTSDVMKISVNSSLTGWGLIAFQISCSNVRTEMGIMLAILNIANKHKVEVEFPSNTTAKNFTVVGNDPGTPTTC